MNRNFLICRNFVSNATALGAKVPAKLQGILDAGEATLQWMPADSLNALQNAIVEGKFTAETASGYLDAELNRTERQPGDVQSKAQDYLARTFTVTLRNGAADQIIDSLRPAFEKARDGFDTASEWITPSTTAEQVLAAGPDAAAAWSALAEHRRTLDNLYSLATTLYHDFQLVPRHPFMLTGTEPIAAFFVGPSVDLRIADQALEPLRSNGRRGGRWTGLRALTQLQWNTATEARRIADAQQESIAAAERRHYAATHS
ncbi:hypothetical protein [Nocardia farcinica]|uniref:Uncharacterized protein n=1 Tax=Nocardia farcinica (strain IFM 10152) TaxID=247156 RepID=Q5Z3A0_NOCFA|nr:hypothetical protein [Nocardia farcinica]BAD55091.1 hypothetical protein NFA_2490 [Nocardia farcinica IFM 10152]